MPEIVIYILLIFYISRKCH